MIPKYIFRIINTKKSIYKIIIHLCINLILVFFVINNFLSMYVGHIRTIWPLKYAEYDAVINGTTNIDLTKQIDSNNIENIVGLSMPMWNAKYIKGDKEYIHSSDEGTNTILGASYQNPLSTISELLLKGCIFDKDESLFTLENAIFISDNIAMKIGAKVGDTIKLQLPINKAVDYKDENNDGFDDDLIYNFKVAAIYRLQVIGESVMDNLMYYKIGKEWIQGGDPKYFMYMNQVYIKFKDKDIGMNELNQFKSTPLPMYLEHGDVWAEKLKEPGNEIEYKLYLESAGKWYQSKDFLLRYAEKVNIIDTNVIVFHTFITTTAISLLFISKNYKAIKLGLKSFGILSASGMKRRNIFRYFAVTSFIEQITLLVLAHITTLLMLIINKDTWFYLMKNTFVLTRMYSPLLIGIIISALISGFFASQVISKKNMLHALSSE